MNRKGKENFQRNENRRPRNSFAGDQKFGKNPRSEVTHPIGFEKLKELLQIDSETELILKLSSERNGFLARLEADKITPDMMCLILAALARASECSTEQQTIKLLVHFYMKIIPKLSENASFQRELAVYSTKWRNEVAEHAKNRQTHIDAVKNLLLFLRRLQLTLYSKSFDVVQNIVDQFAFQIEYINRKGNTLSERILELLEELKESIENFHGMKAETQKQELLLEPPENFREISIYPSTEDILYNHEPFIRKNVVDGKYAGGIDHYLDTQFRLLREDFVRPLRQGISEYVRLRGNKDAMKGAKYRIKDLNIYHNVNIISSKIMQNQQVHLCTFDITPFRQLRWQYNKRMMNGSLMCLSPDDFKTFFFATVSGRREPEALAQGKFQIKLEMECASMPEITPLIDFVMVESQVYFEAYRHNLKVLQEFNPDNFPLERYIVELNREILPPSYLSEYSLYNISNGSNNADAKTIAVRPLRRLEWPVCADFNMDESQFDAFQAALTNQIAVIQGPPGTGKTYIGLRIVETLLANITSRQLPILIVCYTNHALDQFLEGILPFCGHNELIRIGGKSQSEALQKSNLNYIKTGIRNKRQVPPYIHKARIETINVMKQYEDKIASIERQLQDLKRFFGCELVNVIRVCNPLHWRQFVQGKNNFSDIDMLNWLGYELKSNESTSKNVHSNDSDSNEEAPDEPELADESFDEEDINEMERDRLIDYDWEEPNHPNEENETKHHPIRRNEFTININNIVPINSDGDGFKTVNKKNKQLKDQFKREIAETRTMPLEQAQNVVNIHSLSPNQRWDLYRLWLKKYTQDLEAKLGEEIKTNRDLYRNECLRFSFICNEEEVEVVKKAKIIGMTTTGAAKYRHIVDGAKPKITIVEEAAEVLETHIVTALCKETDHLILIGDHMQLKPNPAVYELAKKFNLEVSLFERLINNQMDFHQLKQQHRMRPCISSLLVPHIYKQLLDHPSVMEYENVKGIAKNMFFINHRQSESSQQETRSHMNSHEASFIVELCKYVVLQGYEPSKVTILTTYSGQLHLIRKLMRGQNLLSGVRATVVDNYQGEENDIILLSFVRSNEEANIGFLKTSNRVNVALSRARKGLYCIGNFDCLAEKSKLWGDLIRNLTAQGAIGDQLELFCQNHTDNKTFVASKADFTEVPDGGCMRPCGYRLRCGHSCPSVCHIVDRDHQGIYKKCLKKCLKINCNEEHRCQKKCHIDEECGKCETLVIKVRPQCWHSVRVSCFSDPSAAYCNSQCERIRSCGHKCGGECSQPCESSACDVLVEAKSPCDHTVKIECANANDKMKLLDACTETCNVELKCGHLCKGTCGQCKYGRLHISCTEKCTRDLICGHPCNDLCSVDCPPCNKKCENSCVHSKCPLECGQPCQPCMEKCEWRCEHSQCSKLCSEPCDRQLCEHRNKKVLKKCKHPSIGVCGEKIPSLCRMCDKEEVEEIFFGNEDDENARFIELEDCKHIIEVRGLIRWMQPDPSEPNSDEENQKVCIQLKKCPKCKTEIRHTKALNTFIQASLKDIQQVKLQMYGSVEENRSLQRDLNGKIEQILENESYSNNVVQLIPIYLQISRKTKFDKPNFNPKPRQLLIELDNKFSLVEHLLQICLNFEERNRMDKSISDEAIAKFEERINIVAGFIEEFRNSDQKRHDIEAEISFLQMMAKVIVEVGARPFNASARKLLNDAFDLAHHRGSATEGVRTEFNELVNKAFKLSTGIGISLEEKQMITKAMGFQKGHWFKCPNGHFYCIANCGGAMVTSICPECKAEIGGADHLLRSDNALATEMDGATEPAWMGFEHLHEQLRQFMN